MRALTTAAPGRARAAPRGQGELPPSQICAGQAGRIAQHLLQGAFGHHLAAMDAGARAHIDDVIGGADRILVMFDDDDRVAEVAQAPERGQEAVVVALMQADGGLVEHVKHAGQARADLRGQADALGLAARHETACGAQIFVGLTSDGQWRRFCEHFGRNDLLQNPAYRTNQDRVRERPALKPIVAALIAQHELAALATLFDRIDIPFAPVAKPGDLFDDPQLNANDRMIEIDFGNGKHAKIPRLPVEIGVHDLKLQRQAPAIGEHTAEILAELGLAPADIKALGDRRIVAVAAPNGGEP